MSFPDAQPDWNNLEVLHRNTLPPRAHFYSYSDEEKALTFDREQSEYISLNGVWKFHHDASPFEAPSWEDAEPWTWGDIRVPGVWQLQGYSRPLYSNVNYPFPVDPPNVPHLNETGSYWREFVTPLSWTEELQIRLRFEGVDSAFHVRVNGKDVGYSQGSRNPSEFDITPFLQPSGNKNNIAVRVYEFCDGSYIERQDQWLLSGIFRDVYLLAVPHAAIVDFTLVPEVDIARAEAVLHTTVKIQGDSTESVGIKLRGPDGLLIQEGDFETSSSSTITVTGNALKLWSAESPTLYTLTISYNGRVIPQRIGFRRIEIKDASICVNGKPVIFYGVNRHEHHPLSGRAVPYEYMRADLMLMKKSNINALRCSHQPNDPRLYEVCDELGIYVIAEADLETHGFVSIEKLNVPNADRMTRFEWIINAFARANKWTSDNPIWLEAYLDRAVQLVERFKNFSSVIIWSLGNEASYGQNLAEMYHWIKKVDPTRLVHYEGDREAITADFYSEMYSPPDELREKALRRPDRPLIQCEFGHAMGNGPGGLKDYIEAYRSEKLLQGGFVWHWSNQGLIKKEGNTTFYAYGGDFGDFPNDADFVLDGMVWSDHTGNPGLAEFKKTIEPVTIKVVGTQLAITNHYDFLDLNQLYATWHLVKETGNSEPIELSLPIVKPQTTELIDAPTPLGDQQDGVWLAINFYLREETVWAPKGQEIAWSQLPLFDNNQLSLALPTMLLNNPFVIRKAPGRVIFTSGSPGSVFTLDLVRGNLKWATDAGNVLTEGPELGIYRAMTQNDRGSRGNGAEWKKRFLDLTRMHVKAASWKLDGEVIEITLTVRVAPPVLEWACNATLTYRLTPRAIRLHVKGSFSGAHPEVVPRIGLNMSIPKSFDRATWYGRGPGESYRDKKEAARFGLWDASLDQLHTNYEVPQENGNRTDVRWAKFHSVRDGLCLEARMESPFNFSLRKYATAELDRARHPHELVEMDDKNILHLDYAHHGLGTGACGPPPLKQYQLASEPFEFVTLLRVEP